MSGSFLQMTIAGRVIDVWCLDFSSDLQATLTSAQTQRMVQHFPFRVTQPGLQLTLQTRDRVEAEYIQKLARSSQLDALSNATLVNFFWPQRGMLDWTGIITNCIGGEQVGQTAPTLNIEVFLIDSMVSERTWGQSQASDFASIYYGEIPDIPLLDPSRNRRPTSPLTPPRPVTEEGKPIQGPFLGPDGSWN